VIFERKEHNKMNSQIRAHVRQLIEETCQTCGVPDLADKITFSFNNRFTSKLGDAIYYFRGEQAGWGRVRFSAPLWPRATEKEQDDTIVHEACHVIAHHIHGRRCGHGWEWKALMMKCGRRPERCHNVDNSGLTKKREKKMAYCGCGEHKIGPIKYQRMVEGKMSYRCRRCRQMVRTTPKTKAPERIVVKADPYGIFTGFSKDMLQTLTIHQEQTEGGKS
jgi:predicted SprT family Zn-dependent metalloprotease